MPINSKLVGFIAFILTLTVPALFPTIRLLYFAPFLVLSFYEKPLLASLWYAFFSGVLLDLLSSNAHLGLNSLTFCITTALLYNWQRHFFPDRMSTLFLMTYLFSALATAVHFCMLPLLEEGAPLTLSWIISDLLFMPFFDGLYAFTLFTLPSQLKKKYYEHSFS